MRIYGYFEKYPLLYILSTKMVQICYIFSFNPFFPVESAISELETGILLLSAMKESDSCSERVACTLASAARNGNF